MSRINFHPSSFRIHPYGLVDLARFERATSTFARSRSESAELQVQGISDCGFRIAHLPNKTNLHSAFCNQHSVGGRLRSRTVHGY